MEKEKLKEQTNFDTQKLKSNKAITLIALVVTIVVLLLLAGISISLVLGDNGLIKKSKNARNESIIAQEKDEIVVAYNGAKAAKLGENVTSSDLNTEFKANKTEAQAMGSSKIKVTFTKTGHLYVLNVSTGTIIGPQTGEVEENPILMKVNVSQEDIDNGNNVLNLSVDVEEGKEILVEYGDGTEFTNTTQTGKKESISTTKLAVSKNIKLAATISVPSGNCKAIHTYTTPGDYTVSIEGEISGVYCDKSKILKEIVQWGSYPLKTMYFNKSGLENIDSNLPKGTTSIGNSAFSRCTGLTSITIPSSVTSIGGHAFDGCTGLTSITIPSSVTSIGVSAFDGCTGLTSITIPDSVTSIGIGAFDGCTGLTSITIPSSVTSIGNTAFSGCTGLTSITIPSSVTSIENMAFYKCTGLTSITIPSSVTSIGIGAFSGCTNLTNITVDEKNTIYDSRNNCNAIINKETNTLIQGCKTTTILSSVTSIGDSAFSGCTGLTSITIPSSVTSIGNMAFSRCTGLTSITIPDSVKSIGFNVFVGCTGLISITIPDSVTSIGNSAFSGCTNLTNVKYTGTEEKWNAIHIEDGNDELKNATKTYNYKE